MLARPQSKMTVAFVALAIGVGLVSVAAAVSRLAPNGLAGTLVWVGSLVVAIPLAIAAFNWVCDRFLGPVAEQRQTKALLDGYWPAVQRDLADQFDLNGKRYANGAAHASGKLSGGQPLATPTIPIDPLQRPTTMQRSRHKWWVGQ
jgi:hypothetical protein